MCLGFTGMLAEMNMTFHLSASIFEPMRKLRKGEKTDKVQHIKTFRMLLLVTERNCRQHPKNTQTQYLRRVYEFQVRVFLFSFLLFSTVDLPVHQWVSHRLEDRHFGPLGLAPNLTLKCVVIYNFLCEQGGQEKKIMGVNRRT